MEEFRVKECENTFYYLYTLGDPETGDIRYVGVSIHPFTRLSQHKRDYRRNQHKFNWLKSINFNPVFNIVGMECSREEVLEKEKFLIQEYGKIYKLTNKSNGGELSDGYLLSKETREKLSKSKLGNKNPNYGKHLSEETKRKLSEKNKGKKFSDKHLANLKIANQIWCKKVYQYNMEGDFIREFNSMTEAINIYGKRAIKISECVRNKRKSACGFRWSHSKLDKLEKYEVKRF